MSQPDELFYDTVIVGAGIAGLAYASTLRQLSPNASFLILDENKSIGGVWAKENLYHGLRTNKLMETIQYPDFPILAAGLSDGLRLCPGCYVSGTTVYAYLEAFVQHRDPSDTISLQSKVTRAEEVALEEGSSGQLGWKLRISMLGQSGGTEKVIRCRFLVVAAGSCTVAGQLSFPGTESFGRACMTFAEYRGKYSTMLEDPNVQHVTVTGESKSAMDVVYAVATVGKRVSWIIRKSSSDPRYMAAQPHVCLGPFRQWLEGLALTRPLNWFSASFPW